MILQSHRLLNFGDSSIIIEFHHPISEALSYVIFALSNALRANTQWPIKDCIPAYQSLTLCFTEKRPALKAFEGYLHTVLKTLDNDLIDIDCIGVDKDETSPHSDKNIIVIPTCYHPTLAPDIEYLASYCNLSRQEVVSRHSAPTYFVHMLGFSPGFFYLGGLDPKLNCPRKKSPEISVEANSVGIGNNQTGIYPQTTAGGWQIIGRTPLKIFDPHRKLPCLISPLRKVKFTPISLAKYHQLVETL